MVDHVWTVACSRAVIDQASNNLSLEGVLEQLTITGKPLPDGFLALPFDVATLWARSNPAVPEKARMRLSLLAPSGKEHTVKEFDIDLTTAERYRALLKFNAIPVSESGRHVFRVDLQQDPEANWKLVASIPITIDFVEPPTLEAEPAPDQQHD